jgi:hypothetical protein
VAEDLVSDLELGGNNRNISIGDRTLIPHNGSLNEAVKLRDRKGSRLLKLRDTILGARSRTSPYVNL